MSDNDQVAISIKNVSKSFKLPHQKADSIKSIFVNPLSLFGGKQEVEVQHALRDISVDIKKGEFFGIVGRNGSGKSTLLKIIAEIYRPTEGSIHISGKLVPFIELGVGFNPELTGRENVYLSCALNGFSEKETDEMYDDIVEFAELNAFMDQKLKNYSSGMQVRLAFSVATRAKADILLIDEVLAVGDADFQRKCFNYFKKLKKDKKTVIFVSHDMDAVREYCDRAMLINESEIVEISSSENISQAYTKLFNVQPEEEPINAEGERWGNGKVLTDKIDVTVSTTSIILKQTVRAIETVNGAIVGIRIRSATGESITGTNTKIENIKLDISEKEEILLTWSLPNVLSDGTYSLDPAVLESDSVTVCDWWDDATTFIVKKDRNIPYPVDPGFDAEIKML